MAGKLTVGYWKIRGLAAPLRMICTYAGADFESVEYEVTGEAPQWDRSAWFDVKPAFKEKNAMINLPYVQDGGRLITQSNACLTYLGRKFGLDNKTEDAACVNDQVLAQVFDLRNATVGYAYGGQPDQAAKWLKEQAGPHIEKLEGFFPAGQTYFCGAAPCSGDFHVWEMLDQAKRLHTERGGDDPLAGAPKLKAMYEALRSDPKMKGYFDGPMYALPLNNKMAQFK